MYLKRFIYLIYYFKKLDWELLNKFLKYVNESSNIPIWKLWYKSISNSLKYNISLLEYYQFKFWAKNESQKSEWAGTGYMYEYQLYMNPIKERIILDDKTKFKEYYKDFIIHLCFDLNDLENKENAVKVLNNTSRKLVFKVADGKCGKQVIIKEASQFNPESLVAFMKTEKFDLVEEFIIQHPLLSELSPSAVNTIRIFTQLDTKNNVHLLGSRLRISVNSPVDNMAAGNMAALIDEKTGVISGKAVYSDITKPNVDFHPITNIRINGFIIPFWQECLDLVTKAALKHPKNKSIGWDIAVTPVGPELIEGNHDWCKLLWQLPAKRGLKSMLDKFYLEAKKII
jgi:hypothetical protein